MDFTVRSDGLSFPCGSFLKFRGDTLRFIQCNIGYGPLYYSDGSFEYDKFKNSAGSRRFEFNRETGKLKEIV